MNSTIHTVQNATSTITNNSTVSIVNMRRHTPKISDNAIERCYFLLLHCVFYSIILIIIYVRLSQINTRQESILTIFNKHHNISLHSNLHDQSNNQKSNIDCSCHSYSYPKQNSETQCLELNIGLNETISNVFCPLMRNNQEYYEWFTIQSRQTNTVNFNRSWSDYRLGFGNSLYQTDIWIGNENLYWLTNNYKCRLKIELTDWYNETRIAVYELFRISSQRDDYRLHVGEYTGNMEPFSKIDSFSRWHHSIPFSTYDHYSIANVNCSILHGGVGWWFHTGTECAHVQLNGRLPTHSDGLVPFNTGILWIGWRMDRHYSFQHVRMSIQPKIKRHHINRRR